MNVWDTSLIKEALTIRKVEETFLDLFSQGKVSGTVHTCIGQEFSALAFAGQLDKTDFIFSNHRCHGHYMAFTKKIDCLIAEIMGKNTGMCAGIGSSQHICSDNFFSNGIQGGIVPVAAGMALANKLNKTNNIGIVFIGDGTLGQGVVYETLNIISKWQVPLLVVCENNFYAQSTNNSLSLSGDIVKRAEAFDIKAYKSNTWELDQLMSQAKESIDYVKKEQQPAFQVVETYRLAPHSKGDDHRDESEINKYQDKDLLNKFQKENPDLYTEMVQEVDVNISKIVCNLENTDSIKLDDYYEKESCSEYSWKPLEATNERQVNLINNFFQESMEKDKNIVLLGEDILSPYGGAFKATKGLSDKYPDRVFSTPISEPAITGISNGLALAGKRPFLEIMFGDFMTLCMDQIINHASKFHHMYNKQVTCPVVIRTPMGGRRGYGPTHSQTLDKFLVGIDNVKTIALNTLVDPQKIYNSIHEKEQHPVIVIENKTDYGKKIATKRLKNYQYEKTTCDYPIVRIKPELSTPTATIVTYGGMVDIVLDSIESMFLELDIKPEVLVLSKIHPIDYEEIIESVKTTKKLFVIEEGSYFAGVGSEIIASLSEKLKEGFTAKRITALPVPIPSVKSLESEVLPGVNHILKEIKEVLNDSDI